MNQRAQIELNQIIQRKLSEFRSISASKPSQNQREMEMALKIDDLTGKVRDLEACKAQNETLTKENQLAK